MPRQSQRYIDSEMDYQRYLNPDQGNVGTLASVAVMAALFFTPLGKNVMGGVGKIFGGGGKGLLKTAKTAAIGAAGVVKKVAPIAAHAGWRGAIAAARGTAGVGKFARQATLFAGRHGKMVAGVAVGGTAVAGVAAGIMARPEYGEEFTETMNYGGLPPDNLGATGDLTLAMHNRR